MMTCLTWRTLQSKVFILHFNQHFNMPWSGRRKTTNENWLKLLNKKAKKWWRGRNILIDRNTVVWMTYGCSLAINDGWTQTSKPTVSPAQCWNVGFTCRRNYKAITCMTITAQSEQWLHLKEVWSLSIINTLLLKTHSWGVVVFELSWSHTVMYILQLDSEMWKDPVSTM